MISGRVVGVERVAQRLTIDIPANARDRLMKAVYGLGYTLEAKIKTGNLAGIVLNKRTGRLQRSVNTRNTQQGQTFTSTVGTKLIYGRAWELGFTTPAFDIVPKRKQALSWPGASHPVRRVHMPARTQAARPWLRPALEAMRPEIRQTIENAMRGL